MITRNRKLSIFENFVTDPNLLESNKNITDKGERIVYDSTSTSSDNRIMMRPNEGWASIGIDGDNSVPMMISNDIVMDSSDDNMIVFSENRRVVDMVEMQYRRNRTFINWMRLKFTRAVLKDKMVKKPIVNFDNVKDFFEAIHGIEKPLNLREDSTKFYRNAMQTAHDNGQRALFEVLGKKLYVVLAELKLSQKPNMKYVDENDVVTLYEKTNKSTFLKLTWLKNYTRIIPEDIIKRKKEFDDLYVFNNYVILHFDKKGDASQMTEREKEKARDPILFGVIRNSTRLYYIGDWEDEYCDLTLDKMLEHLGQKHAKKLNKDAVKKGL